jgi:hypothetical protein
MAFLKTFSDISVPWKGMVFIFIFSPFFIGTYGQSKPVPSQQKLDTTQYQLYYLDMKGSIKEVDKSALLPEANVTVYQDTTVFILTESDREGKVTLRLPLGKVYSIHISKEGYVGKIITVNTKVVKSSWGNYLFKFTADLFKEIPGLDVSILKNPVAKVTFNITHANFEYDYNYTNRVNRDVKRLYESYRLLQQADKDTLPDKPKKDTLMLKDNK